MLYFKKGFRSFNTENLRSVGHRASKLPHLDRAYVVIGRYSSSKTVCVVNCGTISTALAFYKSVVKFHFSLI